jgi:O-antigen/teichoic acid export membrane protein
LLAEIGVPRYFYERTYYICNAKYTALKRKFITNLSLFLLLNLLIKPIYVFGIDRVVQNKVGAEVYGNYFVLFNIAIIFQILLDLGIENFIRREIAKKSERLGLYFSNIVIFKLILLVPYFIICFSLALMQGIESKDFTLLTLILFNQSLASFILFIRSNMGGLQLFRTESIVSVLDRTLMILIVGSLLIYPITGFLFRIEWFVLSQTLAYFVTLIIGVTLLFKKIDSIKFQFQFSLLKPIIQKLKPFALLVLLMALYYRSDSIMLSFLLPDGKEQAGIFAHGFRILDFMSNYALLFPLLLLPIFAKSIHQNQRIDGLLQLSVLLLIIPSLVVIAPAIIYRYEFLDLLYDEHIKLSADTFAVLTISYLGMCISYTFGALLTANGNLKQLNIIAGLAVLMSLCLNLILIPRHQVFGAAITNASVQVVTIIAQIILAIKIFHFKFNIKLILKLVLFLGLLLLLTYVVSQSALAWIKGAAVIIVLGLAIAIGTGLISIRGLLSILRQEQS